MPARPISMMLFGSGSCRAEGSFTGESKRPKAERGSIWGRRGRKPGSDRVADRELDQLYLVDLSPSLLDVAERRISDRGWSQVQIVKADACRFRPPCGMADVVTLSYALTMIPDWFAALENARSMLRPGGLIGVVDFYVSRKYPAPGHARHGWPTRTFWPAWFGCDNVFLSPDHVPYLQHFFQPRHFFEGRAAVPYLPLGRVPYYTFIGRKPGHEGGGALRTGDSIPSPLAGEGRVRGRSTQWFGDFPGHPRPAALAMAGGVSLPRACPCSWCPLLRKQVAGVHSSNELQGPHRTARASPWHSAKNNFFLGGNPPRGVSAW